MFTPSSRRISLRRRRRKSASKYDVRRPFREPMRAVSCPHRHLRHPEARLPMATLQQDHDASVIQSEQFALRRPARDNEFLDHQHERAVLHRLSTEILHPGLENPTKGSGRAPEPGPKHGRSLDQLSGCPSYPPIWQPEKALAVSARASFYAAHAPVTLQTWALALQARPA